MKLWLDQMLPRRLCDPIAEWTACEVSHVGAKYSEDEEIFQAARSAVAAVVTKDSDFVSLIERHGVPPQLVWVRCGNCSNRELERILKATLPDVLALLETGEPIRGDHRGCEGTEAFGLISSILFRPELRPILRRVIEAGGFRSSMARITAEAVAAENGWKIGGG